MKQTARVLYTAEATAIGGREGTAKSSDGRLDVALSIPKELGGSGGDGTNPEQLFAAGYAACFLSSIGYLAQLQGGSVGTLSVTATVDLGRGRGGVWILTKVRLRVSSPDLGKRELEPLVHKAYEEVCAYSIATRGNVDVELEVA